jgi:hypothetical protein
MLRTDKSSGCCLDMIGADYLAAANLGSRNPKIFLYSIPRFFNFLTGEQSSQKHIGGVMVNFDRRATAPATASRIARAALSNGDVLKINYNVW